MKTPTIILSFDPTFEGYLSAVYSAFSENLEVIDLRPSGDNSPLIFNEVRYIPSDRQNAQRVWDALYQKGTADLRLVYFAFLSENQELLFPIYEYIFRLLKGENPEPCKKLPVLRAKLYTWAQRVESEKRKLEATLRLQLQYGEFRCCRLRPVYDVLPLLTRHCRLHFGSDPWMLIDTKRRYGLRKGATGIECFRFSVELSEMAENSYAHSPEETGIGLPPREAHPLQAAV